MANEVFLPLRSVRVDASATSKRVALPALGRHVRIFNDTTVTAWVNLGNSSVTAAIPAADAAGDGFPIAPGSVELFREDPSSAAAITHIAVILSGGTGNVNITVGEGW
jgi:hypothetical protein